jgi:hypothetical protein
MVVVVVVGLVGQPLLTHAPLPAGAPHVCFAQLAKAKATVPGAAAGTGADMHMCQPSFQAGR